MNEEEEEEIQLIFAFFCSYCVIPDPSEASKNCLFLLCKPQPQPRLCASLFAC